MRFLLDENINPSVGSFLIDLGHEVALTGSDFPASLSDRAILEIAADQGRVLITNDRDFGELIFRRRFRHAGVIFLRLLNPDIALVRERLLVVLESYLPGQFVVATRQRIRVREEHY